MQYVQDYDERNPWIESNAAGYTGSIPGAVRTFPNLYSGTDVLGWPDLIYPYAKSTQVFKCPSVPNTVYNGATPIDVSQIPHYAMNPFYLRTNWPAGSPHIDTGKSSAVAATSSAILLVESYPGRSFFYTGLPGGRSGDCYSENLDKPEAGCTNAPSNPRHFDGLNYLFYDGHVKFLNTKWESKAQIIANPTWANQWCPYSDNGTFGSCDQGQ